MQTFEESSHQLFDNSIIISVSCIVRKSRIKIDSECYLPKQAINYYKLLITASY